ncbi:putative disrupted in schizophrenia 1 protein-like [Triplophysa rosa]|uniref:Disrupted in schizophrenia 1 protein-like n=1 Tax=Triplophysa rosa TaxID=992332 RepID=A0A9W7WQG9_TRIRA|nr:putative disrupted in schizophrenia 1 protein-like [Triplophysa rosa]
MKLQSAEKLIPSVEAPTTESPMSEEDVMSVTASHNQFFGDEEEVFAELHSQVSHNDTDDTGCGSTEGSQSEQELVMRALRAALARLGLDAAPVVTTPTSAFIRGSSQPSPLTIPPSRDYIDEFQKCWANPKSLTHHTSASRALATMQDADTFGLGQMPKVDPFIASFVLSPDEVLRTNVRCSRPQCRITDDLLIQAYNTAARMGCIGNSLSHLMLALSQSLQASGSDTMSQDLSDASLQAVAFMTRELGRLMSTLMQARQQVWLAQSPLSKACRRTLRDLPVVPGQLFGPAAQQTLERSVQVNQTRQQIADLRRVPPSRLQFRQPPIGQVLQRSEFSTGPTDVHRSQPQRLERSHRVD